jgi:ferric-dicitrate binding protein FerR (iron transport regulator)
LQFETETDDTMQDVIDISKRRRWVKWLWLPAGVAASLLLFFGVFSPAERKAENKSVSAKNTISTRSGSKSKIELPDGTQVWLNADSKLTYDQNFLGNTREVKLTGEAYFDVAHITSQTGQRVPFIIHTNSIDIKVLGTAFNVKSYPSDPNTETSLIRGKVEVTVKNRSNEKIYLQPNEKLVVANNTTTVNRTFANQPDQSDHKTDVSPKPIYSVQHLTYYPVDSAIVETSWVDNRLIFQENETFREVALKMERWYGVKINFGDEEVARIRAFGSFTNETIDQALDALHESCGVNYKISGNEITVTK